MGSIVRICMQQYNWLLIEGGAINKSNINYHCVKRTEYIVTYDNEKIENNAQENHETKILFISV